MMLNLTPLQQSRFGGVLNALAETESERQTEIAKGRENYEKMVEEQKSVQQQRVQTIEKSFNEIVLKAQESKDGRVAYQKRDGDNEWNAAVEKRLEVARNLFFGKNVTTEQVISASLDAASLPAVLTEYDALHKENETLKAQIKALSKSSPSIGAGSSPETAQQQRPQLRVGMRPDEAISGWVKGLMADE